MSTEGSGEEQRSMSKPRISYKWVLIGAGIIFALDLLMRALLADPVKTQLITSFPGLTGVLLFVGIIAFVAFFIGGAMIGIFSPGETIKEPAIAAAIAAGLNTLENFRNVDGKNITVLDWLIGSAIILAIGFVMALGGAWVGEKIQGNTAQKQKEANEPPPPSQAQ
jgi:hypothetical protein